MKPLRHSGFRLLLAGQLASNFGDAWYAVALPWYVLAQHGGALLLGTVLVAYGVPRTVLLVFGGQASDRWRPWTVMMTSDLLRAAAGAAIAVAAAVGPARAAVLVPIAVVLGAGEGLFLPGSFAIVPTLLPDDQLQAGNALTSGGTQLATLVGPAVGGALVAFLGPAPAFGLDAATFAISAATLFGVRAMRHTADTTAPESSTVVSAVPVPTEVGAIPVPAEPDPAAEPKVTLLGLLRSARVLQVMLLVSVAANLGSGGLSEVALPALAHGPLHTGAAGYGALIAAFGAGALVGTIVSGQLGGVRRPAVVGSFTFIAEAVFMGVLPVVGGAVPAGIALALLGACNGFGNVVTVTAFQRWAPKALMGRLAGVLMLASFGIFPVSAAAAALVVANFGPTPFFPIAGGVLAVAILAGLSQRVWRDLGVER